ncbi:MAG: hypothetical protein AABZ30_15715 [Myxococcota bacterium]
MARGGAKDDPAKWVALRAYRRAGDGARPEPLGARMRRDDALLVAYDNAGPRAYAWLMVYAVDASGSVRWYYPAFEAPGQDPSSIAIAAGSGVELPDQVRHPLAAGPMRLHALFSRAALRVTDVERDPDRIPDGAARATIELHVD